MSWYESESFKQLAADRAAFMTARRIAQADAGKGDSASTIHYQTNTAAMKAAMQKRVSERAVIPWGTDTAPKIPFADLWPADDQPLDFGPITELPSTAPFEPVPEIIRDQPYTPDHSGVTAPGFSVGEVIIYPPGWDFGSDPVSPPAAGYDPLDSAPYPGSSTAGAGILGGLAGLGIIALALGFMSK